MWLTSFLHNKCQSSVCCASKAKLSCPTGTIFGQKDVAIKMETILQEQLVRTMQLELSHRVLNLVKILQEQRLRTMQLERSNRVLDLMLAKRGSVRKQLGTTKRKRGYKPFLIRLDELLADGRVMWETDSIFTVTKTTVLSHFSDLSKPTYAFKRAMKSHGFTLHERSTNKLFYFEHKNFKKSSRGMLSKLSSL